MNAYPAILVFFLLAFVGSPLVATPVVEGFEGLHPGPNSPTPTWAPGSAYLAIGAQGPYTFASGVTFTSPTPNTEATQPGTGTLLADFSLGDGAAYFGLGFNGAITDPSQLPGGNAYLAWDSPASQGSMTFSFSTAQTMVGAYVDASGGNIVETAYNAVGRVIGTSSVASEDVDMWRFNFESVSTPGIRSVNFSGDFKVLDNLTFNPGITTPTPEPASLALVGLVLAFFVLRLKVRRIT